VSHSIPVSTFSTNRHCMQGLLRYQSCSSPCTLSFHLIRHFCGCGSGPYVFLGQRHKENGKVSGTYSYPNFHVSHLWRLRGLRDSVYSVGFTPDGKGLVSASLDKTLKFWHVSNGLNVSNAKRKDGPGDGSSATGAGTPDKAQS